MILKSVSKLVFMKFLNKNDEEIITTILRTEKGLKMILMCDFNI